MGNNNGKDPNFGFRCLKVAPASPADQGGLEPFVDFLVEIEVPGHPEARLGRKLEDLFGLLIRLENRTLTFLVYNLLTRKIRSVNITPNKNWGNNDSLLGAVLRYENYSIAVERVYRIARVYPNSPASEAGLIPEDDYLLGSPQNYYMDLQELSAYLDVIVNSESSTVDLWIYNSKNHSVRMTTITPRKKWGGRGLLGCEFGMGVLNELPELPTEEKSIQAQNSEALEGSELEKGAGTHGLEELKQGNSHPPQNEHKNSQEHQKTSEESHLYPESQTQTMNGTVSQSGSHHMQVSQEKHAQENLDSHRVSHNPFRDQPDENDSLNSENRPENLKSSENQINTDNLNNTTSNQTALSQQQSINSDTNQHSNSHQKNEERVLEIKLENKHEQNTNQKEAPESEQNHQREGNTMRTSQDYAFFSKKLNGEYIIKSEDLFQIDKILSS